MNKQCETTRTIKDLFNIYSCAKCKYYIEDYFFYLGKNTISIYYITNCKVDTEEAYFANSKAKQIIKDVIKCPNKTHLMIIDTYYPSQYYTLLDAINELGFDIVILTVK